MDRLRTMNKKNEKSGRSPSLRPAGLNFFINSQTLDIKANLSPKRMKIQKKIPDMLHTRHFAYQTY